MGIINSLAARKDDAAIDAISGLLADANEEIAVAAGEALGKIGGAKSLAALESAQSKFGQRRQRREAGCAGIDDRESMLLTHGDNAGARKAVFRGIYDGQKSESIQDAAFRMV